MTTSSTPKPHIILMHGAWHTPLTFTSLTARLNTLGYTTSTPFLPSVNSTAPVPDTSADVALIRDEITRVLDEEGKNVILVPHSYGGIPTSDACSGLGTAARRAQGQATSVTHIVWLAAFNLLEGQTLLDARLGIEASFLDFTTSPGWLLAEPAGARDAFYNGMPASEAAQHVKELRPHSPGTFVSKQVYAAWQDVESTIVLCEEDRATLPVMQEGMVSAMRGEGWRGEVVRVEAQHCVYLSHEEEVVRVVRRAAGEGV